MLLILEHNFCGSRFEIVFVFKLRLLVSFPFVATEFILCSYPIRLEKSSQVRTVSSSNLFFKGSRFRYR